MGGNVISHEKSICVFVETLKYKWCSNSVLKVGVSLMKISKAREIVANGLRKTMGSEGVTQGIMMFVVAAIMLAVLLPVLNGVLAATPLITSGPLNTTQSTVNATIGSSYGLLVVVLILVAAAVILGAIGLFRYFQE